VAVGSANASSFYTQEHLHTLPNATPSHLWVLLVTRPVWYSPFAFAQVVSSIQCLSARSISLNPSVCTHPNAISFSAEHGLHSETRLSLTPKIPTPLVLSFLMVSWTRAKATEAITEPDAYIGIEHLVLSAIVWSVLLGECIHSALILSVVTDVHRVGVIQAHWFLGPRPFRITTTLVMPPA
jgi:hypothetical protein